MDKLLEELGKVTSVKLGYEDHGILTFWLNLDFGGSGQGFGGLMLSHQDKKRDRATCHAATGDIICRLLDLFGVQEFSDIKGRYVIALRQSQYGNIIGLKLPKTDGDRKFLLETWRAEMTEDGKH